MKDSDLLHALVQRHFERTGRSEFPTVQRVQRTLRWSYKRILQAIADDPCRLFTTSHKDSSEPSLGRHYVEIY
jgi:hypothetical protein